MLICGGGSPKNFALQTEPQIQEVLGIDEKGHDYFLQITDARPDTGGLSGATPAEAVSWGKIDPDRLPDAVVCYLDSTVALPLLTAYAHARHKPRKLKRLLDRREQNMRRPPRRVRAGERRPGRASGDGREAPDAPVALAPRTHHSRLPLTAMPISDLLLPEFDLEIATTRTRPRARPRRSHRVEAAREVLPDGAPRAARRDDPRLDGADPHRRRSSTSRRAKGPTAVYRFYPVEQLLDDVRQGRRRSAPAHREGHRRRPAGAVDAQGGRATR